MKSCIIENIGTKEQDKTGIDPDKYGIKPTNTTNLRIILESHIKSHLRETVLCGQNWNRNSSENYNSENFRTKMEWINSAETKIRMKLESKLYRTGQIWNQTEEKEERRLERIEYLQRRKAPVTVSPGQKWNHSSFVRILKGKVARSFQFCP